MKLLNNSEEITITFDGKEYIVPAGEMEINNDALGNYIIAKAGKWNMDIRKTENSEIKSIKTLVAPIVTSEEKIEEKVEETVAETTNVTQEVKKNNKK